MPPTLAELFATLKLDEPEAQSSSSNANTREELLKILLSDSVSSGGKKLDDTKSDDGDAKHHNSDNEEVSTVSNKAKKPGTWVPLSQQEFDDTIINAPEITKRSRSRLVVSLEHQLAGLIELTFLDDSKHSFQLADLLSCPSFNRTNTKLWNDQARGVLFITGVEHSAPKDCTYCQYTNENHYFNPCE